MTAQQPQPATMRATVNSVLRAAAIYFAIVFAVALVLGPIRVLWLEPWLGETIAVLCEAPFLLAAMGIAARLAPRLAAMQGGWPSYLAVGLIALAMQQVADLAVGFGLRGMALSEQLAYFATPPGYIYAAILIAFALMPLIARLRRRKDSEM
jgi:hypothetical protein